MAAAAAAAAAVDRTPTGIDMSDLAPEYPGTVDYETDHTEDWPVFPHIKQKATKIDVSGTEKLNIGWRHRVKP